MAVARYLSALSIAIVVAVGPADAGGLQLCPQIRTSKVAAAAVAAFKRHDYPTAVSRFRSLAESGNAVAQSWLGVIYNRGKGVPQDYVVAVHWWQEAADRGEPAAQCNLGTMYAYGQGVPQSEVLAHMWFNLAAARGSREARKRRDNLATWRMSRAEVLQAMGLAAEWEAEH